MNTSAMHAVLAASLMLPASVALAQPQPDGRFERTFTVSGSPDVYISTGSGSITVRRGAVDKVWIKGEIRVRRSELDGRDARDLIRRVEQAPPVSQVGNAIRAERIKDDETERRVSISYEVTVPERAALDAHSGSGSVSIDGAGRVNAQTGSGSIRVVNIGGDAAASTGSGSVHLDDVRGTATARTGSGSVEATGVTGGFSAHTGSGSIRARLTGSSGRAAAESGSGSIDIAGARGEVMAHTASGSITIDGAPGGPWEVRASSGDVTVRLPAEAAFTLEARASSGRIDSSHPITMTGEINRRRMHGSVRGGGPRVEIITSSGDIRIQ